MNFLNVEKRAQTQFLLIEGTFGYWPLVKEEVSWMLNNIAPNDEVEVHIDSTGGDPQTAMAVRRMLEKHQGRVTCFVEGNCMSAATLVPGAADEVIAGPYSLWLVHDPKISPDGWMDEGEASAAAEYIRIIKQQMLSIYIKDTGRDEPTVKAWMKETKVFDADEAVQLGFADRIEEIEERLVQAAEEEFKIAASAYNIPAEKLQGRSSSDNTTPKKQNQPIMDWMKKIKAVAGLGDEKDEADAVLSVKELKAKADAADALKSEMETLKADNDSLKAEVAELKGKTEETEEEVEAAEKKAKADVIKAAVDAFRIKAADEAGWLEDYADKPAEKLKAALERIPEGAAKPGGNGGVTKPNARAAVKANLNSQVAKDLGVQ